MASQKFVTKFHTHLTQCRNQGPVILARVSQRPGCKSPGAKGLASYVIGEICKLLQQKNGQTLPLKPLHRLR